MSDVIKAAPPAPTILDLEPSEIVDRAIKIAESLAVLVRRGRMTCMIKNEEFVRVDGWIAMGSLLGLTPHVVAVRALQDGSYEAAVEIRSRSGAIYASASALCSMDEKRWREAPAFSRRSMAITRAIGKAYRISFSWVMRLAGMSATPAEDMPQYTPEPRQPPDIPPGHMPPHPADEVGEPFRVARNDGTKGTFNGQWPKRS